MAPRQNRLSTPFSPIRSPSQSLRRLRTAFSPSRNSNPNARSTSPDSTASTASSSLSPLTYSSMRTASPADSHRSTTSSIRDILRLRRQPSVLELEMEEERHLFGTEVDTCLEPRLSFGERNGGVEVGIFEVLDGRV